MKNELVEQFINRWKDMDFRKWNEADIREGFISPLLEILGYAKDSINDILREETYTLDEPYHRLGRKRIDIDYIPTVRLRKFWIIEAKPGKSKRIRFGDLLQAHFYAIHPEIQARLIVLTNGWEIIVYDALTATSLNNYLLICKQSDCESTFHQLYELLSARNMLSSIRSHVLSTLNRSLEVEVDEEAIQKIQWEIMSLLSKSQEQVKSNAKNIRSNAWNNAKAIERLRIETSSFEELMIMMNVPINAVPKYGEEVSNRIMHVPKNEQSIMLETLRQRYYGRPHSVFRVHCVDALVRLAISTAITETRNLTVSMLDDLIKNNFNYWDFSEISNALVHLDNTNLRVAKKFHMRFSIKKIQEAMRLRAEILSKEDILADISGLGGRMLMAMYVLSERVWHENFQTTNVANIWNIIWNLELIEECLDQIPENKYPQGEGDMLYFQFYGKGFDMLRMGTWGVLDTFREQLSKLELPNSLTQVMNTDREAARTTIPTPKTMPDAFKAVHSEWIKALLEIVQCQSVQ